MKNVADEIKTSKAGVNRSVDIAKDQVSKYKNQVENFS